MYGLAAEIERAIDGVELVELPPVQHDSDVIQTLAGGFVSSFAPPSPHPPPLIFRHRTDRTEKARLEFNPEKPVVVDFLNATDDERRCRFFEKFGFTVPGSQVFREEVLSNQEQLRHLLETTNIGSAAVAVKTANDVIAAYRGSELLPIWHQAGKRGSPHLILQSKSLLAHMLMETANVIAYGARLAACERCGAAFLTGKMTGRRSHSVYCSGRCRMAAMRARQAAAS
jgi:hypothetical protein